MKQLVTVYHRQVFVPMMGQQPADQNALFSDSSLENHVPHDLLLRKIDVLLDLNELRA
jgi:hypothetical protein